MSETQALEAVNEPEVLDADAAAIAEQQADLDAINNPNPEPEPEPEKKEGPPAQDDKAANLQKALAESRFNQRQAQREARETRDQLSKMQETLNGFMQQRNQQAGEQIVDIENDPLGALRYMHHRLQAYDQQAQQQEQQRQQQEQQSQVINQLQSYMREGEAVAVAEFPDYGDAMKHLVGSRRQELAALGYQEAELDGLITQEYYGLIGQAMQNNQNPAYLVYQQAKARGFTGPAPTPTPEPEPTPQPPQGAAQQQIEALRQGQQTPSTGRGGGGGNGKSGTVTIEMLNNAKSEKEFNELFLKYENQNK